MAAQLSGKQLIVIGGGLSGLSYLHYLRNFLVYFNKTHLISKVTLIEANNYMGGSVKTNIHEDGIVHELGPRSIRMVGFRAQNTVCLLEQLGLSDKIVTIDSKSKAFSRRYIYDNGQLNMIPVGFGSLFKKLPNTSSRMINLLFNDVYKAKKLDLDKYEYRDPPLFDFFANRFGQEAAEKIADPILRGITSGDVRQLSTRALFGEYLDKEQAYGSIIKGFNLPPVNKTSHDELFPNDILESKLLDKMLKNDVKSFNISSGLQTIPEHLSNSLLNTNQDGLISIYNSTKVNSIKFNQNDPDEEKCSINVTTIDGDNLDLTADHVVAALPSKNLAQLLPESMPKHQREIFTDVVGIPHAPVGCVCVEYRNLRRQNAFDSFGLLTHSKAKSRVLGIAFDSAMFPSMDVPHGAFRMTCMIGGHWYKEVLNTDNIETVTNAQLEQIALEEISKILKVQIEPYRMSTLIWKTGIAQYRPGHVERLKKTRECIAKNSLPLTLIGQSYDGISVNEVIFSARMAAYDLIKSL